MAKDTQQTAVYEAENILLKKFSLKHWFIFRLRVWKYVNDIVDTTWWKSTTDISEVMVGKAKVLTNPCSFGVFTAKDNTKFGYIKIPFPFRHKLIVLHELAHVLTENMESDQHGAKFCAVYLELVNLFIGEEAYSDLKLSFDKHNVKYIVGL